MCLRAPRHSASRDDPWHLCNISKRFCNSKRRDNITSLVQSALSRWDETPEETSGSDQQRTSSPENLSRLSPAHYLAARGGTDRIQKDFSSQYGGSFIASAAIVTLLYFAVFWLGLSILSKPVGACIFPGKQIVDCIGGTERLKNILFAALGAYSSIWE